MKKKLMDENTLTRCLDCSSLIIQTPGKREKQFCDSSCRSNHWAKEKRRLNKVTVWDATQPTNVKQPPTQPKTNYAVNTDVLIKIEEYQEEMKLLGNGFLGRKRKKQLEGWITDLKKEYAA